MFSRFWLIVKNAAFLHEKVFDKIIFSFDDVFSASVPPDP
jgi:hypothetical protein